VDPAVTTGVAATCPHCQASVDPTYLFCEECGGGLVPEAGTVAPAAVPGAPPPGEEIGGLGGASGVLAEALAATREEAGSGAAAPARRPGVVVVDVDVERLATRCAVCPGTIAEDGYCSDCGTPAPRPRDHWVEQPAPWVAMSCDRGLRHAINQDGGAIAATAEPGGFVALVICDGVSSASRSEVASLAGARAARDVLAAPRDPVPPAQAEPGPAQPDSSQPPGEEGEATQPMATQPMATQPRPGTAQPGDDGSGDDGSGDDGSRDRVGEERPIGSTSVQSRSSVLAAAMREAGLAAQAQAVGAASDPPEPNPPACTFVAAVLERSTLVVGWVGDSRAYWLPETGLPLQLSTDDSWAAEAIALGFSRAEAERAPQAHSITRWLGTDAPDPIPRTVARRVEGPGWLVLCSDGLWNYRSEAVDLRDLVLGTAARTGNEPLALAEALVGWANEQGGHDNITVALARVDRAG
jgi:serine/threonine protein phosphatase PrpC